jgi:hypothetical protein
VQTTSEQSVDWELLHLDELLDEREQCKRFGFPICVDRALAKIFGPQGKATLIAICESKKKDSEEVMLGEKDIVALYEKILSTSTELAGSISASVIEAETIKEIKKMGCNSCLLIQKLVEVDPFAFV